MTFFFTWWSPLIKARSHSGIRVIAYSVHQYWRFDKVSYFRGRFIRNLFMLDLKTSRLQSGGKQADGTEFHRRALLRKKLCSWNPRLGFGTSKEWGKFLTVVSASRVFFVKDWRGGEPGIGAQTSTCRGSIDKTKTGSQRLSCGREVAGKRKGHPPLGYEVYFVLFQGRIGCFQQLLPRCDSSTPSLDVHLRPSFA